jgi:hypothetical protein
MPKKTILFFSRCELVHLYGGIDKHLNSEFNIIHIAYSKFESDILINTYSIPNVINFNNEIDLLHNYLANDTFFIELDKLFLKETDGRFNLNGSIQSDRTFNGMKYDEALRITAIYFQAWKKILSLQKVDFFIHEGTSLMMNHIACILCKNQGGVYSTHIMVQGELAFNFLMTDFDTGYSTELIANYNRINDLELKINEEKINLFLEKFRSSYNVFFDIIGGAKPSFMFYFKIFKSAIKEQILRFVTILINNNAKNNIEYFLANDRLNSRRFKNFIKYIRIKYDKYIGNEVFYFYPLHLEPESVVLYWADGIYSNQVKLIENIASQLPPLTFLYVKDHPHLYGYRDVDDYKKIQSIPNVKLISPHLPGKRIVNDSIGVITLNGTAGLESLLLNKQTITFGSAFYNVSNRVKTVRNVRDFRKVIYDLKDINYVDDYEIKRFVLAYLQSHKTGFTDYYGNYINKIELNKEENFMNIAKGLSLYFNNDQIRN